MPPHHNKSNHHDLADVKDEMAEMLTRVDELLAVVISIQDWYAAWPGPSYRSRISAKPKPNVM
jgi:hypothetical protein